MTKPIEDILRSRYEDEQNVSTHVSMINPKGKFTLSRRDYSMFWDSYCNSIINGKVLGIAEQMSIYMPILSDIDIKIENNDSLDDKEHLYNKTHVTQLVKIYQDILKKILVNVSEKHLLCVVLEKPIYYIETGDKVYAKNGFHLHFPNIFIRKTEMSQYLVPRVKKIVNDIQLFSDIGFEDSAKLIDDAITNVPWLLYGSRKNTDMEPYTVSYVIDSNGEERSIKDGLSDFKLTDFGGKPIEINRNIVVEKLPMILSVIHIGRTVYKLKESITAVEQQRSRVRQRTMTSEHNKISVEEALRESKKLLPLLSDERADNHYDWMTIGWVLYNIGEGSSDALELWLEFSQRCPSKYDENNCVYEWERMRKGNYTIGTLKDFANKDSPEQYKKYKNEKAKEKVRESLEGSHNDVAKVLLTMYGDVFTCASMVNKTWYQFRDHIWEEMEEGIELRKKISTEIVGLFEEQLNEIWGKINASQDEAERSYLQSRLKHTQKMISNLKSSPYKNNVMKECMELFYNPRFKHNLNQNPKLIAFKNGVYDLQINEFRDGRIEDFISKTLPIEYKEYNIIDNEVQDVLDFLEKVFPDKSIRTYFLNIYSDIFVGGNNQKKIFMWTGEGDNGKSITQKFFEMMLGQLSIKFNTQYFTGKKVSSGAANPELVRAAPPVRHATMEEPDADEQLNIGELKKLTGGDSYWARDLFEKGKATREVFPMFMLTFICNKLPKLKYSDKATWNRIRVIPFESTFVDDGDCPETHEEQMEEKRFPMDKEFSHKIPNMVSAFAWYLLSWRQTNKNFKYEPEKVKEATAIYRKHNDIYRQFVEEKLVKSRDSFITLSEIYIYFKEWFKEGCPNMTIPIKNEVKEYFERLWGTALKGNKWKGFRARTIQDDIENGNVVLE